MNRAFRITALALIVVLGAALALSGCTFFGGPKKLKIGLVYDVGGKGDKSFNDMAYAGFQKALKDFADKLDVKAAKDLEPAAGGANREELLRTLAEQKYDLVFGVGFLFTDHIAKVSKEFPNTKFALIDGFVDGLNEKSNTVNLLFQEHEGSFLVGVAAGLLTKSNKVGFVGGMKIPLIEKFEAGYMAGVLTVNPKATIYSEYAGTTGAAFNDPVKGKELALAMYNKGADIIYHASGGTGAGVFDAAATKKQWAIGVDADQSLTVTDPAQRAQILTSMMKRVDVAVYETVKALVEGKFQGGTRVFGLKDGGVGYADNEYNKDYIKGVKAKLEEYKAKIVKGEIKVPDSLKALDDYKKTLGGK